MNIYNVIYNYDDATKLAEGSRMAAALKDFEKTVFSAAASDRTCACVLWHDCGGRATESE